MATEAQNDYAVTNDYTDIVGTVAAIAGVATLIQNIGNTPVAVVAQASATKPTTKTGVVLDPKDSISVTAAHVWVKAFGGSAGLVSLHTT